MATLASGQSVTLYLSADQYLLITTSGGTEGTLAVTPVAGSVPTAGDASTYTASVANRQGNQRIGPPAVSNKQYGPFGTACQAVLTSTTGAITYTQAGEGVLRDANGNAIGMSGIPAVRSTLTTNATLTTAALGSITPFNSGSSATLTLPDAATCWALFPYGLVVVAIKGAGIPTFAAGGSDTLRATSGVAAGVQYGMIAAQVISATEWALA